MNKKYLLAGGDNRLRLMAELLLQNQNTVFCYGMDNCVQLPKNAVLVEKAPSVDAVILPIPLSRDKVTLHAPYASRSIVLQELIQELPPNTPVFGGMLSAEVIKQLEDKGCPYLDYSKSEAFAQMNAVPTAEGAIEIAMHNTDYILEGARVCVVGFGRIGQVLAKKLNSLGCVVTATARKDKDIEKIKALQLTPLDTGSLHTAGSFDIIFNTVPAPVITPGVLDGQGSHTLIIDLASLPGGVDMHYAQQKGIRCIHALSLPAKCAPLTAANIILSVIAQEGISYGAT